ncbi:MAG: cation:proton antiporter [Verrucomicrobia bacterium]|nr:cation:proton antiporter [Verrucomicrobiota bacterium]
MDGFWFIQDLAIVLVFAGAAAWLCQRLGLSVVVGYLLAGALVGPHTPPFALVTDLNRIEVLAQLGLAFLIFGIGLNLNLSRLRNLGFSVIAATVIGALLVLSACRIIGGTLGWTNTASLFLAGMMMVSSSAIIGKVLAELNLTHERPGQLALGVTVLEDVVAVAMLTLLTSLIQFGGDASPSVLSSLGALLAFVVFLSLVSLLMAPRLLARLSRDSLPEIRTLLVAGLVLALGWLAVRAGYSLALGVFVFGAIVGSTRHKAEVESAFGGLQQIFGAVFFVAVGMQVDFSLLTNDWPLVLLASGLAWVLRPLAAGLGLLAVGNTTRESLQAGFALTPLGEFSFIIAQLGVAAGVVPAGFYAAAVGASLLTSLGAPFLTRRGEALATSLSRAVPRRLAGWMDFYRDWLTRLRHRSNASLLWRLTSRRLMHLAIQFLFVAALLLFAEPLYGRARDVLGRDWPLPGALPFVFWSGFGLLLLGPLIALWNNITALAMIVADSATAGSSRQDRLRPLLETALRTVAFGMLGVWLVALVPWGGSLLGVTGAVLLVLLGSAVVLRRRLVRLHNRLEYELRRQFQRASHPTANSAWSIALPDSTADWRLDIEEVALPSDSALAGRTLGELAIRTRFGCSVVGIDRQGYGIANPRADTVLFPRDKLLLLGTAEQLAQAARHLSAAGTPSGPTADFDELTMESVRVPEGCPLAGRPLRELDLIRRAGVQIGGIRRGRRRNLAPSGEDHFEVGDELLLLGTHAQIKQLCSMLQPASDAGRPS